MTRARFRPKRQVLAFFFMMLLCGFAAVEAGAPSPTLQFETPAESSGKIMARGQWLLLIFSPESTGRFDLKAPHVTTGMNHTRMDASITSDRVVDASKPTDYSSRVLDIRGPLAVSLAMKQSWSSVLIEAKEIIITVESSSTTLHASTGANYPADFLPRDERSYHALRFDEATLPRGAAATIQPAPTIQQMPFQLAVQGLNRIQWHNVTAQCPSRDCVDGARPYGVSTAIPGGYSSARVVPFLDFRLTAGEIFGEGQALGVVAIGTALNMGIDGWARFPEAFLTGKCGATSCPDPAGRTFQVVGKISLENLGPAPNSDGRLETHFHGEIANARFDEQPVAALLTKAAWVGGAAIGLAVAAKLLLALFARNLRPVLEHTKAKAIHDLVQAKPGLTFIQIRQHLGFEHGTTQYHMNKLLKAKLVVDHVYGNGVCYFENHGRHKDDWRAHAALNNTELRRLYDWISDHPYSNQNQIIKATTKGWGWTRSTTQYRLKRLLEAKVVQLIRNGVAAEYVATGAILTTTGQSTRTPNLDATAG